MKERPILFSGGMVREILSGRKSQTRRTIKFPKPFDHASAWPFVSKFERGGWVWTDFSPNEKDMAILRQNGNGRNCPYGDPGDRLWVKETFRLWSHSFESVGVEYAAGGDDRIVDFPNKAGMPTIESVCKRKINGQRAARPSIFMPRWASRLTLEIERVGVERLQDITQEDAASEGVGFINTGDFVTPYAELWEKINGAGSWDKNPWVWVVQFKVLTQSAQSRVA